LYSARSSSTGGSHDRLIQAPPVAPSPVEEAELVRARQRSRATVMALLLGLFVVLSSPSRS
jgi:hypothetical protein